jgi:hypothetical protein
MSAAEAIAMAEAAGVKLTANGSKLALAASCEPPPAVLDALRQNKGEIIKYLRRQTATVSHTVGLDFETYYDS